MNSKQKALVLTLMVIVFTLMLSTEVFADSIHETDIYKGRFKINSRIAIINNNLTLLDKEPILINGTTLIPVKGAFQILEAEPKWINEHKNVFIEKDNLKIIINAESGETIISQNGNIKKMSNISFTKDGTLYIPIVLLRELGADVKWNNFFQTISVDWEA